jgi:predicted transcriptional regulator
MFSNIVSEHCSVSYIPNALYDRTIDTIMMTTLLRVSDGILEYIKTGDWITIGEVIGQLDLTEEELMKVLDFLSEFEFIEFDADRKKIGITDLGKRLLELPEI